MKVDKIEVRNILDSRQQPTIDVMIESNNIQTHAQIPSGKSTGKFEAKVLTLDQIKTLLPVINKQIVNISFNSIKEFDNFLLQLDSTEQKEKLGGNFLLGMSLAFARNLAQHNNIQLWEIIKNEFFNDNNFKNYPVIFSNLINGGLHANNNLNIQEYMVVVKLSNVKNDIEILKNFYQQLGNFLQQKLNLATIKLGDEEGYSCYFQNNEQPLNLLSELINNTDSPYDLAIDAAASNFFDGVYIFENKKINNDELLNIYLKYFDQYKNFISIEDPFDETDYEGFQKILNKVGNTKLIVGDDLTVTNKKLIEQAIKNKYINAVIIKPNQIGTISETCASIAIAQKNNIKVIMSHRSGETLDPFVIDFAKACNAYGVKIGAPAKSRLPRYNRLIELYFE
ncbi:MAG: phosphopyruvate hydratase [Minisyncoccia bacterium]